MNERFIAVPFKADKGDGFVEINGIAKVSSAGIVFEYESKVLGMFGGEVTEVQVGIADIMSVEFKRGFYKFFSRIHIRLSNITLLSRLPNSSGKVKLKIKREDFDVAESAVEKLTSLLTDPVGELPPAQTPVAELFEASSEDKYKTNDLKETRKLE